MLAESEIARQATSISRQKNREVSIIHVYTVSQVMTSIFIGHTTASNESHANYSERIGSPPNTSRLDLGPRGNSSVFSARAYRLSGSSVCLAYNLMTIRRFLMCPIVLNPSYQRLRIRGRRANDTDVWRHDITSRELCICCSVIDCQHTLNIWD